MVYYLSLMILFVMLFCGCGKQKQCEAGYDGYLIYLGNPREEITGFFILDKPNLNIDSVCHVILNDEFHTFGPVYPIIGTIPKEFRSHPDNPIPVHCTLNSFVNYQNYYGLQPSKILCIYKI